MRRWKVWPTIPIVASSIETPEESKQAERSTVLAERLHLEAIGVSWQHELNQSWIANINPSQAMIAEHVRNRRAAVAHCLKRL